MAMTGETFIWIKVSAARICDAGVLSLMDASWLRRPCWMFRTCCCEVTSESM